MVKKINIILEDDEHEKLKKEKGSDTWEEALRKGCEKKDGIR